MPRRHVVIYPHPALTTPGREVCEVDDDLRALVSDMVETMHAEVGVGLAANQVDDLRRVFVLDLSAGEEPGAVKVMINPVIVEQVGRQTGEEGCLSFPGIFEHVERPARIRVRYRDLDFEEVEEEIDEFYARVVCHETDHLDGIVFLKRMSPLKRRLTLKKIEKLKRQGEWPAAAAL
ncbi:MAG: peptide deformylase [Acidobacteriota bacterium]|nr:peptide deformylase [Acidobacteriota bacterium]